MTVYDQVDLHTGCGCCRGGCTTCPTTCDHQWPTPDDLVDDETIVWPYGPPEFHEDCCRLHRHDGVGFCDCKASDASDVEWGLS